MLLNNQSCRYNITSRFIFSIKVNKYIYYNFKLKFIRRLELPDESIFYSGYYNAIENKIILYGRSGYRSRSITKSILDTNFNTKNIITTRIRAEDPRVIILNKTIYMIDNFWNDTHLIDIENLKYIRIGLKGKNFVWLIENANLYFLHQIKPIIMYKFNIHTKEPEIILNYSSKSEINGEYRGGTPFYNYFNDFQFALGHRTYLCNKTVKHDPFVIIYKNGSFTFLDIEKPSNAKNIFDPCSVIKIGEKLYLTTAESEYPWFRKQNYYNNLYELIPSFISSY